MIKTLIDEIYVRWNDAGIRPTKITITKAAAEELLKEVRDLGCPPIPDVLTIKAGDMIGELCGIKVYVGENSGTHDMNINNYKIAESQISNLSPGLRDISRGDIFHLGENLRKYGYVMTQNGFLVRE